MDTAFNQDSPDNLVKQRWKCLQNNEKVKKMQGLLKSCDARVKSKSYTAETCSQEVIDLMEALDHCVGNSAFRNFA
ncbi:cytochrome b-c1 complex subunit 6, mitochondrial-like [Bicyclus anynana]|uniref:Cytochrome b-c1 complex subunit 6, mitochondrial-like n=1 Tax=Bicyclus anynana TaxID=110368 RepID=A0ABM3M0U3_BICAN|nr:cytochrome b-c1 complex subunit 6, mitochondrial-like [Bicyclus anynana]